MCAHRSACQNCSVLRFHCPDFNLRIEGFQSFSYTCDGAAGAYTRTESVDRAGHLLQNLQTCMMAMNHRVGLVLKLLRNENLWVFCCHFFCGFYTFIDAVSDIAFIVNQNYLCSVMLHKEPSLAAYGIGHDDNGFVALNSAYKSKADSLVAAGRFHNNGIRRKNAVIFGFFNHIERSPGLDRPSYVKSFIFYQHPGAVRVRHAVKLDHRGIPHSFKHIVIYHFNSPVK